MLSFIGLSIANAVSPSASMYLRQGLAYMGGMEPNRQAIVDGHHGTWNRWGGADEWFGEAHFSKGNTLGLPRPAATGSITGFKGFASSMKMPAIGLAATGYFAYQGYKENGISGAAHSVLQEIAITSAMSRWGFTSGPTIAAGKFVQGTGLRVAGTALRPDKLLRRGAGAGVGSMIGEALFGTPGSFLGAYIGAAPLRFLSANPAVAAGVVGASAAAVVGYGTYSVIRATANEGYQRRQNLRGVDSAGSTAAFMTQAGYTMRSRAISAISKSHLNARSALGQESSLVHRPYVNALSRYR